MTTETIVTEAAGVVVVVSMGTDAAIVVPQSNETPVIQVISGGPQGIQGPKGDTGASSGADTSEMLTDPVAYYILAKG